MTSPIFSNHKISNKVCPKCGGKRDNDIKSKNYGTCKSCHSKWWIV